MPRGGGSRYTKGRCLTGLSCRSQLFSQNFASAAIPSCLRNITVNMSPRRFLHLDAAVNVWHETLRSAYAWYTHSVHCKIFGCTYYVASGLRGSCITEKKWIKEIENVSLSDPSSIEWHVRFTTQCELDKVQFMRHYWYDRVSS